MFDARTFASSCFAPLFLSSTSQVCACLRVFSSRISDSALISCGTHTISRSPWSVLSVTGHCAKRRAGRKAMDRHAAIAFREGANLRDAPEAVARRNAVTLEIAVVRLTNEGVFKPTVSKVFNVADIAAAHDYLEKRKSIGKVVVQWSE